MPWWSWLFIWTGLALTLLAVLGWFAITLYRKSLGTLRALAALSDQVSAVDLGRVPESVLFTPAVFSDSAVLSQNVEQRRGDRAHRRQLRRDARILRGKLMRKTR